MSKQQENLVFHRDRHIRYWLRCARTFLPQQYTSSDANRMTLAFFILSALDILGLLHSKITPEERESWIDWIYSCQVPGGGFRGFSGTNLGPEKRTASNSVWDPANIPATFFAIVSLIVIGDDLDRLDRDGCLSWLPKLQRDNGSFGETLAENGMIEGGSDLRFCCCAAGIRYILQEHDPRSQPGGASDLDVDSLIRFVASCQVSLPSISFTY